MMKYICLITALVLLSQAGKAQGDDNILKNYRYTNVAVNNAIETISATEDSLTVTFSNNGEVLGRDRYLITSREDRGVYRVVYVQMVDAWSLKQVTRAGDVSAVKEGMFGVFALHFEKEDGKLLIMHDARVWPTEKACIDAFAHTWLPDEYFNTWYQEDRFERFTHYPDFRDADESTTVKVAVYWMRKLQEHREKKANTFNTDRNWAEYGRDNLTKVLVNNRLSPLATPADFNNKLYQFHIKIVPNNQLPQPVQQAPQKETNVM